MDPLGDDIDAGEQNQLHTWIAPTSGAMVEEYTLLCGDKTTAAIFVPSSRNLDITRVENITMKDLVFALRKGLVSKKGLFGNLPSLQSQGKSHENASRETNNRVYYQSLDAVQEVAEIYSQLPGAHVDLHVTSITLSSSQWWKGNVKRSQCMNRELSHVFSCVALFETGRVNVTPDEIGNAAIAISNSNSIFVASELLLDPTERVPSVPITRITGNVGKPGLAFLVTPPKPKVRPLDYANWNVVSHEPYDGKSEDSFRSTSLHLSFTGYELSLDVGQRGSRDSAAVIVETVVSLYDRGEWIGDLDILSGASAWAAKRVQKDCLHSPAQKEDNSSLAPLVSVDSWSEFLDRPVQNHVMRAHQNATARLAAAALAAQQSRKFVIMSPDVCWECLRVDIHTQAARRSNLKSEFATSAFADTDDESDSGSDSDEAVSRVSGIGNEHSGLSIPSFAMGEETDTIDDLMLMDPMVEEITDFLIIC